MPTVKVFRPPQLIGDEGRRRGVARVTSCCHSCSFNRSSTDAGRRLSPATLATGVLLSGNGEATGEQHEETALMRAKGRPLDVPGGHDELLTQQSVFGQQLWA